jgi:hypothetical protein
VISVLLNKFNDYAAGVLRREFSAHRHGEVTVHYLQDPADSETGPGDGAGRTRSRVVVTSVGWHKPHDLGVFVCSCGAEAQGIR